MGIPDGAHTHGGGGGIGAAVAAVVAAVVAVKVLPVVVAAVASLVELLLYVVAGLAAFAVVGVVTFAVYRVRHRDVRPARALVHITPPTRPAAVASAPPRALPAAVEIHHHWHGISQEAVAAVIREQGDTLPPR
jgi:hypothetical protein